MDKDEKVYVADQGNDRIQVFDNDGQFLPKWGTEGTRDGLFSDLWDIAVNGVGKIYVADLDN